MVYITKIIKQILVKMIQAYQKWLSGYLGANCRFYPTCSHYALDALKKYGLLKSLFKILYRIVRCGPWHPGGYDPA